MQARVLTYQAKPNQARLEAPKIHLDSNQFLLPIRALHPHFACIRGVFISYMVHEVYPTLIFVTVTLLRRVACADAAGTRSDDNPYVRMVLEQQYGS